MNLDSDMDASGSAAQAADSPFSDELLVTQFYSDEALRLGLNKLLHLAPYSSLIMVSGPAGAGKTALLSQFVDRALNQWRVAVIALGMLSSRRDFVQQIAQALGVRLGGEGQHADEVPQIVSGFLKSLARGGRRAVLLIDNAELLSADMMAVLEDFIASSDESLGVVLASERAQVVEACPALAARMDYSLQMPCFNRAGVEGYIRHRLSLQGQEALMDKFDGQALDRVFAQSLGVPGAINAAAQAHLLGAKKAGMFTSVKQRAPDEAVPSDSELPSETSASGKRSPMPPTIDDFSSNLEGSLFEELEASAKKVRAKTIAASTDKRRFSPLTLGLVGVGLVLVAVVLYFQDEINQVFEASAPAETKVATGSPRLDAVLPANEGGVVRGDIRRSLTDVLPADKSVADAVPEVVAEPESRNEVVLPEMDIVLDEPVRSVDLIDRSVSSPKAEPVVVAVPIEKPAAKPPEKKEANPPLTPAVSTQSEVVQALQDPLLPRAPSPIIEGADWLLAQSDERYTMQVMALADEAKVRALAAKYGFDKERALYHKSRNGDPLVVFVYGSYPDKELALQAARQIPKAWGFGMPWVRSFAAVRGDVLGDKAR